MSNYSQLDRLLHYLALNFPFFGELSFDLEKTIFGSNKNYQQAVYVTGLARAGTTALMRALHDTNQFASLTYDDMPFVLSPNLWGKISALSTKQRVAQERAHGDGIQVDFDAPEALEEAFWKLHCGSDYITQNLLHPHSVDSEIIEQLLIYQNLICKKYGKKRYLAKNNNLILRLTNLAPQTKDNIYLVVFRDPISQSKSLLTQHLRFRDADPFTQKYMTWLAHHEFGATHRPFQFAQSANINGSPEQFDYWLQRWIEAYSYLLTLLQNKNNNIIPVSYERLCSEDLYWKNLCSKINISATPSSFRTVQERHLPVVQNTQITLANNIYQELSKLTFQ